MTRAGVAALCALGLAGCSGEDDRVVIADQGFSIGAVDGWDLTRQGNDAILTPAQGGRQTIAVRTGVRRPGRDQNDPDSILSSTARVLAAMPLARLEPGVPVRAGDLEGTSYRLRFVPPGQARAYERTHVTLVGQRHFFHVILTAPAGDAVDRGTFDAVVASLREEA